MNKRLVFLLLVGALVAISVPWSSAFAICVINDRANLRSGPGRKFDKTWEVYKFMPFKTLSARGQWLFVQDLEGDKHWLHKKLVTKKHRCAVVKVPRASLRTGPSTKHKKDQLIPEVHRYTAFKLLQVKSGWAQVYAENGKKYWIARSLLWVH